jgi:hypothetical protein
MPLSDAQRTSIVQQYGVNRGRMSQKGFCYILKTTQGIDIAPRTLRDWCRRFKQPLASVEEFVQIFTETSRRVELMMEALLAAAREKVAALPSVREKAAQAAAVAPVERPVEVASPTRGPVSEALPPRQNDTEAGSEDGAHDVNAPSTGLGDQAAIQPASFSAEEPLPVPRKKRIHWDFC